MKPILTLIFLNLMISSALAQNVSLQQTDSLKHQLSIATKDTTQVLILSELCEAYRSSKPDSALLYGQQALIRARQINFSRGEVYALLGISVVQRELGNLPAALAMALKALKIAEDKHYNYEEINSLVRAANVYFASKDLPKALSYFKQAEKKLETIPGDFRWCVVKLLIGDTYEQMNQLDSALFYEQQVFQEKYLLKTKGLRENIFRVFGNIYVKRGNNRLALDYYQKGIQAALREKNYRDASTIYTNVASLYKKMNQTDSAIYYAMQGLAYGQKLSYKNRVMAAGNLLAELYEPKDAKEALRYYRIANAAKDSLYSTGKMQALQAMTFDEQERQREIEAAKIAYQNKVRQYALLTGLAVFLIIALILYRNNLHKQKAYSLLQKQKQETDAQKAKTEKTLEELKAAQFQLIQSEKMASLGELTAGIAHEIQNPLNFVNNFSEVNKELIIEMKNELRSGNLEDAISIADNVEENELKISHHGQRADAIVKGMLQHSRVSTGKKEPTDINALADEYLRLSYHGLRAKDNSFNANFKTDFDESIGIIEVVPQDIGRVLLNLYNNAFYAVNEKKKAASPPSKGGIEYEPTVTVTTSFNPPSGDKGAGISISVKDNGSGIPQKVLDKIFQPFFTTKPTGQGTGLGLSLSYDIVKAHGGELKVETNEGEGAEFIIQLPGT